MTVVTLDALAVKFWDWPPGVWWPRRYERVEYLRRLVQDGKVPGARMMPVSAARGVWEVEVDSWALLEACAERARAEWAVGEG